MVVNMYDRDLAYIHDAGFTGYALGSAPGLLRILRDGGVAKGQVIDLGCGSGRLAGALLSAGYDVLGIDISPSFLQIARRVAPRARFLEGSLWDVKLPPCDAVTSIGECANYRCSGDASPAKLFRRIHAALRPGGIYVFDAATPARLPKDGALRVWTEGDGWVVMGETSAGRGVDTLERRVVCFRRINKNYRRTEELHRLRLFRPDDLMSNLRDAGFQTEMVSSFGRFRLPEGIVGFVAKKAA